MINCPQCGDKFDEKTGRRPKRFCSDDCKVTWWNEQRSPKKEEKRADEPPPKSRIQELMEQAEQELKNKTK